MKLLYTLSPPLKERNPNRKFLVTLISESLNLYLMPLMFALLAYLFGVFP